jgi:hypothetical protein
MRKATFFDIFGTPEKIYNNEISDKKKVQANQEEHGPKKFIKP